ncbi:chemerin-like receptor 1 [Gastrophryne carolinensis]
MENSTNDYWDLFEYYNHLENGRYIADVYLSVALSVVSLLGTVGNGLVIWFVVFKMKKTVTSVWFLSLALADFTFSLFQPLEVIDLGLHHWPFGGFMCYLRGFVTPLNMFSSILQLTVISIDRWACVAFPFWCRTHRTTRLAWMVTLGVWVLAAGCSLPYFINTDIDTLNSGRVFCLGALMYYVSEETVILRFMLFFVVPLIIIVSCYTVIILRMRRSRVVTATKPFRMITAIIICFFTCWMPFHVCHILYEFHSFSGYGDAVIYIVSNICMSLAYANSCVNPFLYVFFGRDFKERFWSSIQSAFKRALTEEPDWRDPERPTAQGRASADHDGGIPLAVINVN